MNVRTSNLFQIFTSGRKYGRSGGNLDKSVVAASTWVRARVWQSTNWSKGNIYGSWNDNVVNH